MPLKCSWGQSESCSGYPVGWPFDGFLTRTVWASVGSLLKSGSGREDASFQSFLCECLLQRNITWIDLADDLSEAKSLGIDF
jgi:hypothetical protein